MKDSKTHAENEACFNMGFESGAKTRAENEACYEMGFEAGARSIVSQLKCSQCGTKIAGRVTTLPRKHCLVFEGFTQCIECIEKEGEFKVYKDIDVENIFTYQSPTTDQIVKYQAIRSKAKELAKVLLENTPCSEDQFMAIRKLRECVMTANASIALEETKGENK